MHLTDWGVDMRSGTVGVGAIPATGALAAALNARYHGLVSVHPGKILVAD